MALAYNQALLTQPNFSELVSNITEVTAHHQSLLETLHSLDVELENQLGHSVKLSRSVRLSR